MRRYKAAQGLPDINQAAIVKRARQLGFEVIDLSSVGRGVPDLIVSSPLEMWLVEVKRLEVKGLKKEFKEAQREFYGKWKGKDLLVWYELADVDLLFLFAARAGHFHYTGMSAEGTGLCQGWTPNLLSDEPKRRGGGHCLSTNMRRLPERVHPLGGGVETSTEFLSACKIARNIHSGRADGTEYKVLEDSKGK